MPENRHAGARTASTGSTPGWRTRPGSTTTGSGGKDNFAADRIAGEETIAAYPAIRASARANRAFLARSVRYLAAEAGIRQFLDIGTGLPTASNTHEVAQSVAPDSRIVYVDNDPLVLAHARALLTSRPEGATGVPRRGPARRRRDPRAGGRHPRPHPAGRRHAAGHPALHPRPGPGPADHGPAGQRHPVRQLRDDLARGQRHLARGDGRDDQADEPAPGRGQPRGTDQGRGRGLLRRPGPARARRGQGHPVAAGSGRGSRGADQPVGRRRP